MPTYGYACLGCERSFETVQRITDDALTQCDNCGGVLKKKVFPVGVVFKGSGFYVNDYAKKGGTGDEKPAVNADNNAATADPTESTAATEAPGAAPAASEPKTPEPTPAAAAPVVAAK